jgi:alanine racemase
MNEFPRRAWVDIDLGALVRNAQTLQRRAAVPLLPMVKADGYGLGALPVVRALERIKPWGYGVATVAEGVELRDAGIERPLVVFTPLLPEDFPDVRRARLTPTLGDPAAMAAWIASGTPGPWHLAIDTGMRRSGIAHDEIARVVDLVRQSPPEGAFTHFHSADSDPAATELQQTLFEAAVAALPARPRWLHAENSPSMEWQSPSPWDLARPGIFLYGVSTAADSAVQAHPVAHLRGRVVDIRPVPPGGGVSYGHTWQVPAGAPRRIATVNAGYADGVRRAFGNRTHALLRGQRVPLVGVVTMDMTMIDVTDMECAAGDVVTFLGRDGAETIDIATAARAAQLSPYEVLTGLRCRATRRYHEP